MTEQIESLEQEAETFLGKYPGTRHLDAFLIDLSGNAFGKRYPAEELVSVVGEGSTMCAAMQLTDVQGISWDTLGKGFSDGDPDAPIRAVPGTLAPIPWAPEPRAQVLMTFDGPEDGGDVWWEPRTILRQVAARFTELSLTPVTAVELEFYLIDRERGDNGAPQPPRSPATGARSEAGNVFAMRSLEEFGPVIDAIEAACRAQNIPVTTISKEYGPGQYEINLKHLSDPVAACDHAAMMRRAVIGCARAQGFDATFMSKPYTPESGSGLQINLSLTDPNGRNIFDPKRADGEVKLGHAIAGMQALYAESLAIFAPNLNAYRRFEPNQFTPVTLDWGENNRSVAFRIPRADGDNKRIEHRAAGAEANPYLVMAAVLAAAHHGLSKELKPTGIGDGNVGEEHDPAIPATLWGALDAMAAGTVLPGYLGRAYIDGYIDVKRNEFDSFLSEILPREYAWYL